MTLTFLHTADWQLGMTRRYLSAEAQARFAQARLDAIARLGQLAAEHQCAFVAVAGDTFDSNHVERTTLARALEALAAVPVPVLLVPGNHDAYDAASIYRAPLFAAKRPSHVHLLVDGASTWQTDGAQVVGVPWTSRRPGRDLLGEVLARLAPSQDLRVLVAHGRLDAFRPARREAASMSMQTIEHALSQHAFDYLALGDRHSTTAIGDSGRVWYAGAPEPTDFDEEAPGHALLVSLTRDARPQVRKLSTATWRFLRLHVELDRDSDVAALQQSLTALADKERTVLRLDLRGSLDFAAQLRLDAVLADAHEVFAAVDRADAGVALPEDALGAELPLPGWPATAARALATRAAREPAARDALILLHRLARGQAAGQNEGGA